MLKKFALIAFKFFASITFLGGLLMHILGLYYGREYFFENILTPKTDAIFSIPMTLAAIFSWLALDSIDFQRKWGKTVYITMEANSKFLIAKSHLNGFYNIH